MDPAVNGQMDAVLKYLPILKRPDFVASTRRGGEKNSEGVMAMPWEEPSPQTRCLIDDLYANGFVEGFDWGSWQDTARQYVEEPGRIAQADLDTLKKLLTTHVRKDRFCEGHFTSMIECGHITAILERLKDLRANGG